MTDDARWAAAQTQRAKKKKRDKSNKRLLGPLEEVIYKQMDERNSHRDTDHLHPSEMAKANWCLRQTFWKMQGLPESNPEVYNLRKMNIFAEGHNIHDKWQEWLRAAGVLWGNWDCKWCGHRWEELSPSHCPECFEGPPKYAEVDLYDDKHKIMGHTDGWIKDAEGDALLEIKSVGIGTIRWEAPSMYEAYEHGDITLDDLWKRIRRPLASHNRQIQLYMYVLGVPKAVVLYEWKPTQEVREFHLELDMDVVQPLLDGALAVLDSMADLTVPLRPVDATGPTCNTCRFCNYREDCWSDD